MKKLTVEKPWGQFKQFTHNELSTVKIISLNSSSSLSLQYHNNRTEFWRIISGHPIVTVGETTTNASPGDEFFIDKLQKHRIETKDEPAQFLEIAHGDFDEEDITRLEDKYGRA